MVMLSYSTGMYLGGEKIGYTIIEMNPTGAGYILQENMTIKLGMMGQKRSMETTSTYYLDKEYRLKEFSFNLKSDAQDISSSGKIGDGKLIYSVKTGGIERTDKIEVNGDVYISQAIPFIVSSQRKPLSLFVFDPTIFSVSRAEITILEEGGDSIKYKTELLGTESITWISKNGEVLRSQEPMGVIVLKEEKEGLKEFGEKSPEILTMFSIPAGMDIKNPRGVTELKAVVKGRFKTTERQRLSGDTLIVESIGPDKELIPTIPSAFGCSRLKPHPVPLELKPYIASTPLIQTDDKRIKNKSTRIVKGAKDDWEKVEKLLNWVSKNVKDTPSATIPSALDVLETLKGDCNEHTALFCALSRAQGIPTDVCVGLVLMNGNFYYHAWNKVWVGKWVNVDPTFNQTIADATHITLEEGELKNWAKIMDLVGNIEIKVVEYR